MIYQIADWLHVKKKYFLIWRKRRKIFSTSSEIKKIVLPKILVHKYQTLWKPLGNPSTKWLKLYIWISQIKDHRYVPENFYYSEIESKLNNKIYTLAYADKNFYEILLKPHKELFPRVFLRKINGILYDENFDFIENGKIYELSKKIQHDDIIVKPSSESAGGRNITILKKEGTDWIHNGIKLTLNDILIRYPENFILQERIQQHSYYSLFNPSSVNTVRMLTYRSIKDNQVHVLHNILRVGQQGKYVDNQASGGVSIGINSDGYLNDFAVNKYGQKINIINGISLLEIKEVPEIHTMRKIAQKIAPRFFYNRLLAFDFCVDQKSNVKILEVNLQNIEINFHQMNNGPLFKDFTEEIIKYCQFVRKSVNFDFYV